MGALDDLSPFGPPPVGARVLLFDLDGTLVRIARRRLTVAMLGLGARRFRSLFGPIQFARAYAAATARVREDVSARTNHDVLVDELCGRAGAGRDAVEDLIDAFVAHDMQRMGSCFAPVPGARQALLVARELGYELVLATNPMWSRAAAQFRLDRGGLGDIEFEFVAHSRAMSRCKPSRDYFGQLLRHVGAAPEECVMVGDDPVNDVRGAELGIRTVLVRPGGASLADLVLWLVRARTTRARYPLQMGGIEPSIARET